MSFPARIEAALPRAAAIIGGRSGPGASIARMLEGHGFAVTHLDDDLAAAARRTRHAGVLVDASGVEARDSCLDDRIALFRAFAGTVGQPSNGAIVLLLDQRPGSLRRRLALAAQTALIQSLALEFAPRVRINGIGPGPGLVSIRQTPVLSGTPLGHTEMSDVDPADIANAALATLALPSMTGRIIPLDGERHAQVAGRS